MTNAELLKLLEIVVWPTVVLVAVLVVRPHLSTLLSGAKVKLSIAGQAIETTLPQLKQIVEEQTSEALSAEHVKYLSDLYRAGPKAYPEGVDNKDERKFLRPMRNAGLIMTEPRNVYLNEANAIELSALGRLFLKAKGIGA